MNEVHWDYVFLLSNEPVPSLVEKVKYAISAGRRVALVYMSRPWTPLRMDTLTGATVFRVPVSFHGVGLSRIAHFIGILRWLRREVLVHVATGADVYTDSIDLLAIAQLAAVGRQLRYRFEVRDLHPLQLGSGPVARAVQFVERCLLRRVSVLVLTSSAHYQSYYRARFAGTPTYVENIPSRAHWSGFRREPSDKFIIGFIGVLRYRQPLETLIAAVKRLNASGLPIHLRIAGGGVLDDLRAFAGDAPYVQFEGPFKYDEEAQRLYADLAIVNSVYDADGENVRLAISNKFYESQITRIPIMVAEGTHLAELVRTLGIGTAVRHSDVEHVASAIAEAYCNGPWYRSSRERLQTLDVDRLFQQHDIEIAAAVLGPPHSNANKSESASAATSV